MDPCVSAEASEMRLLWLSFDAETEVVSTDRTDPIKAAALTRGPDCFLHRCATSQDRSESVHLIDNM